MSASRTCVFLRFSRSNRSRAIASMSGLTSTPTARFACGASNSSMRPIQNLLDAGTGTGRMLELLAPHANRAVGVDVSPDMLAIARDRLLRENLKNTQVRLADIYRLPFTTDRFDAVLFHQVLHYLDDPGAAVAEVARVMAP